MSWGAWSSLQRKLRIPQSATSADPYVEIAARTDLPQILRDEYGDDISGIIFNQDGDNYSFDVTGGGGRHLGVVYFGVLYQEISFRNNFLEFGGGSQPTLVRVSAQGGFSDAATLAIHSLLGGDKRVCASTEGLTTARAVADNTTSAAFVSKVIPTFNFVKQYDESRLKVDWAFSSFSTAIATEVEWALRIGGVDYTLGGLYFNVANCHTYTAGSTYIAEGISAGLYSPCTVRWRRAAGGGTLNTDAGDWYSCIVTEVDEGP